MKKYYILFLVASTLGLNACTVEEASDNEPNVEETETLENVVVDAEAIDEEVIEQHNHSDKKEEGWRAYFDIKVPDRMIEMTLLNEQAIAQFSYVEEVDLGDGETEVKEHYLLIMMELKDSIEGYPIDLNIDAESYSEAAVRALRNGRSIADFKVLTEAAPLEKVNGMDCVKNEMEAKLDVGETPIDLFYKLAVFEGGRAFYQILTWCIASQKDDFEKDMDSAINSFREK